MDIHSYQSFEEPRTASRQNTPIKSVQSWKNRQGSAQKAIISSLNDAAEGRSAEFKTSLNKAMGYAPQKLVPSSQKEAFRFNDVIDMVNPLHHIPVVGVVYRNVTGDELHPISNIIGGALYGGPVGAVTGTMNAVSKIQTGKDFGDHVMGLVMPSSKPNLTKNSAPEITKVMKKEITMTRQAIGKQITAPPIDDITMLKLTAMPPRRLY